MKPFQTGQGRADQMLHWDGPGDRAKPSQAFPGTLGHVHLTYLYREVNSAEMSNHSPGSQISSGTTPLIGGGSPQPRPCPLSPG